jgi:membrane-bound lytic murein transglycosylase F
VSAFEKIIVLSLGVLALSWSTPAGADLAEIEERGTLRVLVAADELPHMFSFEESGDPGLEREMVESFARSRGLKVEVVPVQAFDDIIPALVDGRGDLITGIINTPARREQVAFTPTPPVQSLDDLRERKVGTVTGSSWTDAALEAGVPASQLVQSDRAQMVLRDLRVGAVEAAVMSVTDFAEARRADDMLQAGVFVGSLASAGWAVRREDTQLRRALDEFLKSLLGSPSWNRIVLKYFNKDALDLIARGRR